MRVEGQFDGRLALQQRVLPSYRVAFFDLLAKWDEPAESEAIDGEQREV